MLLFNSAAVRKPVVPTVSRYLCGSSSGMRSWHLSVPFGNINCRSNCAKEGNTEEAHQLKSGNYFITLGFIFSHLFSALN